MAGKAVKGDGSWLTATETGDALRISPLTVVRMVDDGDLIGFRARSTIRIWGPFVTDALAAIRAGATINFGEFARQWREAHGSPVAAGETA